MEQKDKKILSTIIDFLEKTSEDSWCTDVVRTKGGGKNCVMGHIYAFGAGGYEKDGGSDAMDAFEENFATTFMIYDVNDGINPKYQQDSPRKRVLAYLKDMIDGKQKTTKQLWKEYATR